MPPKYVQLKFAVGICGIAVGLASLCLFFYLLLVSVTADFAGVVFPSLKLLRTGAGIFGLAILAGAIWLVHRQDAAVDSQSLLLSLSLIWTGLMALIVFFYLWLAPIPGSGKNSGLPPMGGAQISFGVTAFAILAMGIWMLRRISLVSVLYLPARR